jgi:quercetin dioxygenase-like cupin family protein
MQTVPISSLPGLESRLVLLEYPPGVAAPIHSHPVPTTGYVLEGDVISQWEGGEIEMYSKGDSFVDLGETMHLRSENSSQEKWLRMVLCYVIRVGEANVIL